MTDSVSSSAATRCANCDGEIIRADVTMQGPRGPWIHERTRTRMCQDGFTTPRFAGAMLMTNSTPDTAALLDAQCTRDGCTERANYDLYGRCLNCGQEVRGVFTVGHEASSGVLGQECPMCCVRRIQWRRERP